MAVDYYSRQGLIKEIGIIVGIAIAFIIILFILFSSIEPQHVPAPVLESNVTITTEMPISEPIKKPEIPKTIFNPLLSGDRNLGKELTWKISNVSGGYANVTFHVNVYDYRVLGLTYTYYSNEWGQWFTRIADPGKKFMMIWVRTSSEGTTWYPWDTDSFHIWVWSNTTIEPDKTPMNDLPIKYGSEKYRPITIKEVQDLTRADGSLLSREWYGYAGNEKLVRQEPGLSNAWEGMILTQIPVGAEPEDIRILGWFDYYGYGVWYLTEHEGLLQVKSPYMIQPMTKPEPIKITEIRGKVLPSVRG